MAAHLAFAETLKQPIQRCKRDLLKSTETGDEIGRVGSYFKELEEAVAVLDEKYSNRSGRLSTVQRLIPSRRIIARSLRKVHGKIIRRLHTRPRIADPWRGECKMDMPLELFDCISKDILQRTSFGQRYRETRTETVYEITDLRKAKFLFGRMDLDGSDVDRGVILKKCMALSNSLERCEVVVSNDKPMELKFNKTKELFVVKFHYGYWNPSGIPQH